jgi:prepilin-type processing-associated H-X9-DG protein/prepilin-type N-terminal cleavage/methylation domain-containing protein
MNRAFSLVELMIVAVVIAILVAMLMPTIHAAWDAAASTQCQTNLNRMWQAINTRRAATGETGFIVGGAWPSYLSPYLDGSVFHCPLGAQRDMGIGAGGESTGSSGSGGTGTSGEGSGSGSGQPTVDTRYTVSDLTFRIFSRGAQDVSGRKYADGQFLGTAFADSSYGVQVIQKDGYTYYGIDDRLFFLDQNQGSLDYKDIQVNLWLDGDRINRMEFAGSDDDKRPGSSSSYGGSYNAFRFEVYLGEEKISNDFYSEKGKAIDFSAQAAAFASAYATATSDQVLTMIALMPAKSFDYGLNKGTYDRDGARVSGIDPRMPLLLDYGKSVVDYESAGTNTRDNWYMYFTADEQAWMFVYHSLLRPGETWLKYVALRHGGRANVLFCDGHIEPLGPDELAEDNQTLWQRIGK